MQHLSILSRKLLLWDLPYSGCTNGALIVLLRKPFKFLYSLPKVEYGSMKNRVWLVSLFAGLVLYAAADRFTTLSDRVRHALLMLVGVIAPLFISKYLDG